jgi:DegV family protein with EDD domain
VALNEIAAPDAIYGKSAAGQCGLSLDNTVIYSIIVVLFRAYGKQCGEPAAEWRVMDFQIISDSACDLTDEAILNNIVLVPFQIVFDDEHSYKENIDLNVREFYQYMVEHPNVFPKTALPSVQDYLDVFSVYAEKSVPMVCVCISSKISGSYNSASVARDMILEEYPDAKIEIVDSRFATILEGLLVLECVKLRDRKVPYDRCAELLRESIKTGRIVFTVGSVDYLKAGGRISKFAGAVTSTFGIRPVIAMKDGELHSSGITLNRKKSLEKVLQAVREYLSPLRDELSQYSVVVGYGYDLKEAEAFAENLSRMIANELSFNMQVPVRQIGSTIGVHTGPQPLGVGILKQY